MTEKKGSLVMMDWGFYSQLRVPAKRVSQNQELDEDLQSRCPIQCRVHSVPW